MAHHNAQMAFNAAQGALEWARIAHERVDYLLQAARIEARKDKEKTPCR